MSWRTYSILKTLDCIRMVQTTDPIQIDKTKQKSDTTDNTRKIKNTPWVYGYKGWEWDYEEKVQPVTRIISPGADTGFKWGGGRLDFLGTKKFIIRNKKSRRRRKYFWPKTQKSQNQWLRTKKLLTFHTS